MIFRIASLGLVSMLIAVCAKPSRVTAAEPTYWQDIRPLMRKHCTVCHSQKTLSEPDVSAGLALDTYEAILKGHKDPVVKKGKGDESLFISILRHPKPTRRMPLDAEPLPDETVAILKRWVDAGVPEGVKPKETDTEVVTAPGKTRKLDVALATKTPLPKTVAKPNQTGPLELVLPVGPLAPITALVFSPDGKQLVSGCYGRVVIWDMASGAPAKVLTNVLGAVNDIRFAPDGKTPRGCGRPTFRSRRHPALFDERLETAHNARRPSRRRELDFLPLRRQAARLGQLRQNGPHLGPGDLGKPVLECLSGQFRISFTASPSAPRAIGSPPSKQGPHLPDGRRQDPGKSILTFSGMEQDVLTVAVPPDGEQIVTSGFEAGLYWWNPKNGERLRLQGGHAIATNEIVFTPKGEFAVSASADRTVRTWDTKTGAALKTLPVGSMVYSVAVRHDGKLIASGSFDGLVRIWEPEAARLVATLLATPAGDWITLTPEVFCHASDSIVKMGKWKTTSQDLPADMIWKAARQPAEVTRTETPDSRRSGSPLPGPSTMVYNSLRCSLRRKRGTKFMEKSMSDKRSVRVRSVHYGTGSFAERNPRRPYLCSAVDLATYRVSGGTVEVKVAKKESFGNEEVPRALETSLQGSPARARESWKSWYRCRHQWPEARRSTAFLKLPVSALAGDQDEVQAAKSRYVCSMKGCWHQGQNKGATAARQHQDWHG